MEDQEQVTGSRRSHGSEADQMSEPPLRSRWAPKPEQILILESIFNSGMVNPPKDDTVRIRRQLEKFGPVGDANVFYWFQNRRSRSRRRQRQLQASLSAASAEQPHSQPRGGGGAVDRFANTISSGGFPGSSSSFGLGGIDRHSTCDDLFSFSGGHQELSFSGAHQELDHQSAGKITVFINGVETEVRDGTLDVKDMFGGDFLLFHSSGMPADQVHDHGFLVHHGESYFLVPKDS